MHVRLVVQKNRSRKQIFSVYDHEAILGRGSGCAIRIPSAEVSRRHCKLLLEENRVLVEDLESVNGTYLNGTRVQGAEMVYPGDQLEIGPVTFAVEYELPPEALDQLDVVDFEVVEAEEAEGAEDVILAELPEEVDDPIPVDPDEEIDPEMFEFDEERLV